MSYLKLIQSKAFKEQIYKYLYHQFEEKTTASIRKRIKQDITRNISIIMYYENGKALIFKVLSVVVYCLLEKYVRVDYFCLQRESKLLSVHKGFENTSLN